MHIGPVFFLDLGVIDGIVVTNGTYIQPCDFAQQFLAFLILCYRVSPEINLPLKYDLKYYPVCLCVLNYFAEKKAVHQVHILQLLRIFGLFHY